MARIRALFLDLDSTLLDGRTFHRSIERTCKKLSLIRPELDAKQLREADSEVFRSYWPESMDDWTLGRLNGAELSLEVWRRALLACGCEDKSLAQVAADTQIQLARDTYRPFADVEELISIVRQSGVPVALVTNGASDTQREKIDTMGITNWFSAFAISGETGVAKPDEAAFTSALEALGVSGKSVWHVGDSLAADVAGANAAGLTSVWLNRYGSVREEHDPEPDVEIPSLSDLKPHLLK